MPVTLGARQTSTTVRPAAGYPATNLVKTSFFFEIDPERRACAPPILGIALMRGFPDRSSLFTMSVNLPASIPVRSGKIWRQNLFHADEAGRKRGRNHPRPEEDSSRHPPFITLRCSNLWWSLTGSNRRHPACKAGALPAELRPLGLEIPLSQAASQATGARQSRTAAQRGRASKRLPGANTTVGSGGPG